MIVMAGYLAIKNPGHQQDVAVCTQDAKICSDGTSVTRSGPLCEFPICPNSEPIKIFDVPTKTVINWMDNIQYEYPVNLSTKYITANNWPPKITFSPKILDCKQEGSEVSANGITTQKIIGGDLYCVHLSSEGAAGSSYTTYRYTTIKNGASISLEFILRSVNCGNYDDPSKKECSDERQEYQPDVLAKDIISTVKPVEAIYLNRKCYEYDQVATKEGPYNVKENIDIKIDGSIVSGIKKGNQSGPDMTNGYEGTLKGEIKNNIMTVIYEYTIEGSKAKEQEEYKIVGNSLIKQRYPLVMKDNILIPDKTGTLKEMEYKPSICILNN